MAFNSDQDQATENAVKNPSETIIPAWLEDLGEYSQIPQHLQALPPYNLVRQKPDIFGVRERLNAITSYWPLDINGTAVDLGGNSGYFSLSLLERGLISASTVYDMNGKAMEAGKHMAESLGLSEKVRFVSTEINIDMLRQMAPVDVCICLNLIHHAGATFDIKAVTETGWEHYARTWLQEMKRISRMAILGVGLKGKKPIGWTIPKSERTKAFRQLIESTGWQVTYDGNVQDIHDYGIHDANGLRSGRVNLGNRLWRKLKRRFQSILRGPHSEAGDRNRSRDSKRQKYHLFLLVHD